MFIHKKLDKHKEAIDDGFEYCERIYDVKIRVYKTINGYYIFSFICSGGIGEEVISKDFDNFKTKIKDFYGGDNNGR